MNDFYITMKYWAGCAINISHLADSANRNNLLNIILNAIYYNYRKLNYHQLLSGLGEFVTLWNNQDSISDWLSYSALFEKYQLALIAGNKVKNYIKSYEPELYFPCCRQKLEYIFKKFTKESQIKFKKHHLEFEQYFFQELINYILKCRLQQTRPEDQFIYTYLLLHNHIEISTLKSYTQNYLYQYQIPPNNDVDASINKGNLI